jgi:pimeloyl-ACP methyl ester carboxylesterase
MMTRTPRTNELTDLYRDFTRGRVSRRDFIRQAVALGVVGAPLLAMGCGGSSSTDPAEDGGVSAPFLDLAEWSYFWLGAKPTELERGSVVNGEQMYVEYWTPAEVRHPYPMVIVHGGGGQGLDWLGRPDGGPGWVNYLLQEGYRVYLVDRPGHGRAPFHPELHGGFGPRAAAYEGVSNRFTAPEKAAEPYGPQALLHDQWLGTGVLGDPTLDQLVPGQGGSFLRDTAAAHAIWAERGGELLDRIGPSLVMCHSAGGPSGFLFANVRPGMVRGIIGVEPSGPPFGGRQWGVTASPLEYDPPAVDPSELETVEVPAVGGRDAYLLLAEPRRLVNLLDIPIAIVTAPASYHWTYDMGTVAFLRQCGCTVEHLELENSGITGNGHFMMMEANNRAVLQPILDFLQERVTEPSGSAAVAAAAPRPSTEPNASTAMRLADHGFFWVGIERREMDYGVIAGPAMFVQYLIPDQVRHELPVVLVHGGTGQMLHYMGAGGGVAGWAQYYVQAGYRVYLVDRPGHGRCVYHPDALGDITPTPTYEQIQPDVQRAVAGGRWPGSGDFDDPVFNQFMASQNGMPQDIALQHALWASHGAELLDRIGPAIIQTHSFGGPFGWLVADQRPDLVRAIIVFESAGEPFRGFMPWGVSSAPLTYDPPAADPGELVTEEVAAAGDMPAYVRQAGTPRRLVNLQNSPTLFLTADASARTAGPAFVEVLRQAGAPAEHLNLRERGIVGNGHFAMIETNRWEVFEVIRGWVEQTLPPQA